jgi:hypothetical protein
MASLILLVGRFLFLCSLSSASAILAGAQSGSITSTWVTDLRAIVKNKPLPYVYAGTYEIKGALATSLWFTNDQTLIATFVTREGEDGNPKLSGRKGESLPLRLQAVFLDSVSGKVTASRKWPSDSRNASVIATLHGKFVTQTGNELTLYNSNLEEIKSINLPPSSSQFEWHATPSSTGENILLRMGQESKQSLFSWMWIKTQTLDVVHSWEAQPEGYVSITDDRLALNTVCTHIGCDPSKLEITTLSTGSTIEEPSESRTIYWVNDDEIFMPGDPRSEINPHMPARLIRAGGEILYTETQLSGGSKWWSPPIRSSEGKRFVVPGLIIIGAHPSVDISGHTEFRSVLVYDLPSHGQPYVLEVKGANIKDLRPNNIALSPDGSQLAILSNTIVRVFQLPPMK